MSARTTTSREPAPAPWARFEARARAARWRSRRPVVWALMTVVVLAGLWAFAWFGPLLVVKDVQVRGLPLAEAAAVRAAARVTPGQPLARVDTMAVEAAVAGLPYVASVRAQRAWPSTLRVVVERREPVAAVPRPGGGFELVDATGVGYASVVKAPSMVPVVAVDLTSGGKDALDAALTVLRELPTALRASVTQVSVVTANDVRLRLGTVTVAWGGAADTELKARVLQDLRSRRATRGTAYDVSSPKAPVVR